MGVDVVLYAQGPITDDEIGRAEDYLANRMPLGLAWRSPEPGEGWLYRGVDDDGNAVVSVNTPSRYYGVGYERGDWPAIYGAIRLMERAFPNHAIHYGGDSSSSAERVTTSMLDEMWAHFLGPDGDKYHRVMTAASAKLASR